jgi:hypothetical protein
MNGEPAGMAAFQTIAVDASGAIVVTGTLVDEVDFCGNALTSASSSDVFAAKILP